MSKNTQLTILDCYNNQLTSLDVSKNTALSRIYIANNQFSNTALDILFGTLHNNDIPTKYISIHANPGSATCNSHIAESKGWIVDK